MEIIVRIADKNTRIKRDMFNEIGVRIIATRN